LLLRSRIKTWIGQSGNTGRTLIIYPQSCSFSTFSLERFCFILNFLVSEYEGGKTYDNFFIETNSKNDELCDQLDST
jgi:hypothetical protein